MLIEGDNEVLQRTANLISTWGMDVRTALNSHGALGAMSCDFPTIFDAQGGWRPDLIISDYQVGRQIWVELILSLRSQHVGGFGVVGALENWHCPVILLAEDPALVPEIFVYRGSAIVPKPVREEALWLATVRLLHPAFFNEAPRA